MQFVDLRTQYLHIKDQVDQAIQEVIDTTSFIKGKQVHQFEESLANYLSCKHVIGCANGTDALQIALMALDLNRGDEIIVPTFTYVATAEVIALLGLKPVMVDVDPTTFNVTAAHIERYITSKTKAIVPVHLFGQSCDMEPIMALAKQHGLFVIEDNAQAIGADYKWNDAMTKKTGTIGHIGTTSFFPSKNLGCYGDGGAIFSNNDELAKKMRMIANHGQRIKYYHDVIGCNSRLDSIQAAVLNVKLQYLDNYGQARADAARYYSEELDDIVGIITPQISSFSTHVFHQYTLRIEDDKREALQQHLKSKNIPTAIYYPLPLYRQNAFAAYIDGNVSHQNTELLCRSVLSLPMHSELNPMIQDEVIAGITSFYNK